jgi:hypothetical protein
MKFARAPAPSLETLRVECGLDKATTHLLRLAQGFQTRISCHGYFADGPA